MNVICSVTAKWYKYQNDEYIIKKMAQISQFTRSLLLEREKTPTRVQLNDIVQVSIYMVI